MKRIFKKNQIIITSLAALIAVAGYLNHIESKENKLSQVNETVNNENETTTENAEEVIESNDIDMSNQPGEAVFVNAIGTVDFIVEAKLLREQTRATSKSMLMEVVNNTNLTESEKTAAVGKISELADIAEREMAAENLIAARGYENVVVTITDNAADVMIVSESLSDVEKAQIEEIVKTKAQVTVDKITITAVKTK